MAHPIPGLPLSDLPGFTHHWPDAAGVRLHAVTGGTPDGPAVVLLAGFPQTWWAWRKVLPGLARRFRVLAIDLPGQGHSERPDAGYDTHTAAARVQAAVAALGVSEYWLAAHDIGAWVAFSLAARHESRLRGLALLDAGIPGITLPESVPLDPGQVWKTWHFAFHLVPDLPEALLTGRESEYVSWFLKTKSFSPGTFDDAEINGYAAALGAEGGLRAGLAYYRHTAESARENHAALTGRPLSLPCSASPPTTARSPTWPPLCGRGRST